VRDLIWGTYAPSRVPTGALAGRNGVWCYALGFDVQFACADRRPRRSEPRDITAPKGGALEATGVVGGGANHRTRGRVRSPLHWRGTLMTREYRAISLIA
jgi:hypothetical protein